MLSTFPSKNKELYRDFTCLYSVIKQTENLIDYERFKNEQNNILVDFTNILMNETTKYYILYFNTIFLNHIKINKFIPLTKNDIKRNNCIRVDGNQLFLPINQTRKEQLFFSSFILAFFSVYDTRQMKVIEFTKNAVDNFYKSNRKIKIFMNLLMLNPNMIRIITFKREHNKFISDLLELKIPPSFIYNMLLIYKNSFILTNYAYRLLIGELKKQLNKIV